jgi:hypothetical protein
LSFALWVPLSTHSSCKKNKQTLTAFYPNEYAPVVMGIRPLSDRHHLVVGAGANRAAIASRRRKASEGRNPHRTVPMATPTAAVRISSGSSHSAAVLGTRSRTSRPHALPEYSGSHAAPLPYPSTAPLSLAAASSGRDRSEIYVGKGISFVLYGGRSVAVLARPTFPRSVIRLLPENAPSLPVRSRLQLCAHLGLRRRRAARHRLC